MQKKLKKQVFRICLARDALVRRVEELRKWGGFWSDWELRPGVRSELDGWLDGGTHGGGWGAGTAPVPVPVPACVVLCALSSLWLCFGPARSDSSMEADNRLMSRSFPFLNTWCLASSALCASFCRTDACTSQTCVGSLISSFVICATYTVCASILFNAITFSFACKKLTICSGSHRLPITTEVSRGSCPHYHQ